MVNNSLYGSALASMVSMKQMDVIANNLANANTPGFKVDRSRLTADMNHISRESFDKYRKQLKSITNLFEVRTQHAQGALKVTGHDMDLAIEGDGYFEVQDESGNNFYTRCGTFRRDTDGYLVDNNGYKVMGEGGPIELEDADFVIRSAGDILVNGEQTNVVKVVSFEEPAGMQKRSGTIFDAGTQEPQESTGYSVVQGALEMSNVNPVQMMVKMIEVSRGFQSKSSALKMVNEVNQKMTSTLSKPK